MKTEAKAVESSLEERQAPNSAPTRKGAKTRRRIISGLASLLLCLFALIPSAFCAASNDLTSALQRGLFEEEANHNLDAAAQAYLTVSAQFDKDRKLAATAIFRLGEVYRKQGKTNEATAQYERIMREFSDQQTLATLSRQNLAGIGAKSEATISSPLTRTARLEQKRLLEEEIKLVEQDLGEARKLLANGLVSDSTVRAKEREVLKLRQQVAALDVGSEDVAAGSSAVTPITDDEEKEIRRIQEMIKNSPDLINAPAGDPAYTPLCRAARLGQLRVAKFLLDAGAAVDLATRGSAPVHLAAANGHKAMVELFLDRKANVSARDNFGKTPLHLAAENGFQSVAETLLAHKADVHSQSENQETPLHLAAAKGHAAMVNLLLAKGAQADAASASGGTAQSRRSGRRGVQDDTRSAQWTPLMWAAMNGHADIVKRLLEAKADANAQDASGRSALSFAVERGHLDVVKALLEAKADLNASELDLPLPTAARFKHLEIAVLLLDAGAKPDLASKTSQDVAPPGQASVGFGPGGRGGPFGPYTALQIAVAQGDAAMVKSLFKFKADANAKGPWHSPPKPLVFYALANVEMFNAFLDAGAEPNVRDSTGPLIVAAAEHDASRVEPLITHGANVNVRGSFGNLRDVTPVHVATIKSDSKSVELLLKAKADVNAAAPDGWTALHQAAYIGSKEIVEMLLAYGAGINAKSQKGDTPLHWAVGTAGNGIGAQKMVDLLLSKGADPNVRGFNGWTPLDRAKGAGYAPNSTPTPEIAAILREHGALDDLPDFNSIRVTRVGAQPTVVFLKGTNSINRFTLLEVIRNYYPPNSPSQPTQLSFPDFSKIIIHRPVAGKPGAQKEITVNLLTPTNSFDCGKDTWLEFGDVVEIPEREHTLAEGPVGMTHSQQVDLGRCFEGKVTFVVRGQKAELQLNGYAATGLLRSALGTVQNLLRSSSDLSHIKVTRTDSTTGKTSVIITDSKVPPPNNLWLRDGDVIEVPDKP